MCLQITPYNINHKNFTSSTKTKDEFFALSCTVLHVFFFLGGGDLTGTKLHDFVLGAPNQDGIKTSPFAVFCQDAIFFLVFGCATSKNT